MAYQIYINGVDRTTYAKVNSASFSKRLNSKSSMSCQLEDLGRGFRPAWGQSIRIDQDGTKRFGGIIQRVRELAHPGTSDIGYSLQYDVQADDYTAITDRRLITGSYGYATLASIVNSIVTNFLEDEGITTTNVATGPTLNETFDFNYEPVRSVFDKLSAATGYLWYIDEDKDLHFSLFTSEAAPFGLTASSANWYDLSVDRDSKNYRNQQYARTEYNVQNTLSITQTADGSTRDYFTGGQIMNTVPTVTLNGTPQTVGRLGADPHLPTPGYQCYYDVNGVGVHWPSPLSPPANGVVVVITAVMEFTNVVMAQNATQIAARQAVEGGSGKYQAIREDRNISTLAALSSLAEGELRDKGGDFITIEFSTRVAGLRPGQRIDIDLSFHSINEEFLIESVDYRWVAGAISHLDFFEHTVRCTNQAGGSAGTVVGRETNMFRDLVEYARIGPSASDVIAQSATTEESAAVGTFSFTPALYAYGTVSVENCAVAGADRGIESIILWVAYVDEETADVWAALDASMDATTDPITVAVTPNAGQITPGAVLSFATGDYVLFGDAGKYEIAYLSSKAGNNWTLSRAQFGTTKATHASAVRIYKAQIRKFVFDAATGDYANVSDVTAVPDRLDMELPNACVLAIVGATRNDYGTSAQYTYNCAQASVPGLRTLNGGNYTFQRSGDLAVASQTAISKRVQYPSSIRVAYATVETAPTGSSAIVKIQRSATEGASWEDLETLTIAVSDAANFDPDVNPPGDRRTPYSGSWPFPILRAEDLLDISITQIGSTVAGANLTVEVYT